MNKIIPGKSSWKEMGDTTMLLTHYYVMNNKLHNFEALCPCEIRPYPFNDDFLHKVTSATKWLESTALPNLSKNSWGNYSYAPEERRGYVTAYPEWELVEPWPETEEELIAIFVETLTFKDIFTNFLRPPYFLEGFLPKIIQASDNFLASDEVCLYLCRKAEEMADFWVSQIGCLGTNGDANLDMLHAIANSFSNNNATDEDAQLFKDSMIAYTREQFAGRRVPFYDTDYSIGYDLRKVLEKGNLEYKYSKKFPWKTWKHFDFSDAPMASFRAIFFRN